MNIKKFSIPVLLALLVIAIVASLYLYSEVSALKQDPDALAQKEAEELVAIVGKLIILPPNEIPTIATVSDPTKLAGQAFFAKAKVGDKVLLYPTARKAYLYDPKTNKILEVAPINLGGDFESNPEPVVEEPVKDEAASDADSASATSEEAATSEE